MILVKSKVSEAEDKHFLSGWFLLLFEKTRSSSPIAFSRCGSFRFALGCEIVVKVLLAKRPIVFEHVTKTFVIGVQQLSPSLARWFRVRTVQCDWSAPLICTARDLWGHGQPLLWCDRERRYIANLTADPEANDHQQFVDSMLIEAVLSCHLWEKRERRINVKWHH